MLIKYDVEAITVHAGTKHDESNGDTYVVTIEAEQGDRPMPTIWLEFQDPRRAAKVLAALGKRPVYFNHKRVIKD